MIPPTLAQFEKLKPALVREIGEDWKDKGYKFWKRSRNCVGLACNHRGTIIIMRYAPTYVKVDGKELDYIGKYDFTNPSNPFSNEQELQRKQALK